MLDLPLALQAELLGRLLLSVLLGGLLGWERQMGQHPAGLRTHILVTLGAAAFTLAGVYGVSGQGTVQDAGRVAAQVVTGIGFLGAGTIWRSGSDRIIYGLTTAASIWVAASIGMLAGFGQYVLATGCALLGFGVLRLLKNIENLPQRFSLRRWRGGAAARDDQGDEHNDDEEDQRNGSTVSDITVVPVNGKSTNEDGALEPAGPNVLPHLAPKRRRKAQQKKGRKRKRRDAEDESDAQISDAPPP
jgi:uncharacterized membrane protein YhiD involved in acid resistance